MAFQRMFHDPWFPMTVAPWAEASSSPMLEALERDFANSMRALNRDVFRSPQFAIEGGKPAEGEGGQLATNGKPFALWRPRWPALNYEETDNEYVITADVPGYAAKGDEAGAKKATGQGNAPYGTVSCDVEDGVLTITAEHSAEKKDDKAGTAASTSSSYRRSVRLPEGVRDEDVKAAMNHGVLRVSMPKPAQAIPRSKSKTIRIETGEAA